ncbi:Putative membrane protein YdgH [Aquisphaera giovannonii]|uniref:Membrane protein YdgH n=1 Tax=Aquisphaera giovannonii TaxID=406548 RepID=A0A5B9VVF0_9BACT|nr:MMPL family transporter [Aquisphaera giovannonii]QEH32323.1 Putative membrane protein YdgH [Aquisphaera giovannonii]
MPLDYVQSFLTRRPGWVVAAWLGLAAAVGFASPSLTRLAAEGQSKLLGPEAESRRAADLVRKAWPKQAYEATAVLALHRPSGLTDADRAFASRVQGRFERGDRPKEVVRVLGPDSDREIAGRLVSADGTLCLVVVPFDTSYVAPSAQKAVAWLQDEADALRRADAGQIGGLELRWTGDAVIGRDYMAQVQTSLDRAAAATVALLLVVLLVVYRSIWLAMVPLLTIGLSLVIARGLLAWLCRAGWEVSPLVELFLVALLFGTGTDFCLFLSWRFAEHYNERNPAGVMRLTLGRSLVPLVTSAGTIVVGLLLMGTTKFKLFSTTGPSVALGLAISLAATLTLAPALLVLLARYRPKAFRGFAAPSGDLWDRAGRVAMSRPLRSWGLALLAMMPLAVLGTQTRFVMDLLSEMPRTTESGETLRLVASRFDPGMMAPLTVVLESDADLRRSEGLALIDDVSRLLSHQRRLTEVRSATQPLGSPEPLARARLSSRLGEVNDGFRQLADGAGTLNRGLTEGAAKLRAALWLGRRVGLNVGGALGAATGSGAGSPSSPAARAMASGLGKAAAAGMARGGAPPWDLANYARAFDLLSPAGPPAGPGAPVAAAAAAAPAGSADPSVRRAGGSTPAEGPPPTAAAGTGPAEVLLAEITRAADGADQIAKGARRAHREVSAILEDPVGRRALDRLLITPQNIDENPDLRKSFGVYITDDGHRARIDVTQGDRVFSDSAMNQVEVLRRRLREYLGEYEGIDVRASIAGANAESADVRLLTHDDQVKSWFVVPIGVFLVLLLALRDPWACFNLVATMVLTYLFALGATHLLFVTILGAEGLDWKVPYFLFVLLVAVGVDYNVFLMARLHEETARHGFRGGIVRAIGQTGGLISSAAAITACSFASFLSSPLASLRQLGFALVVGITVDALLVRPLLVPCGHWLLRRSREVLGPGQPALARSDRLLSRVPD